MRLADVVIVGGGIVGLATADAILQRWPDRQLVVLEAEDRLAAHQTGHNSGVIHSGLYYAPGSLKALNCTRGREALYAFCEREQIPHERCGKLVVATTEAELPALERLIARGTANGLAGLRQLGPEELREYEPHVAGVASVWVRETGIVDYPAVAQRLAQRIQAAGGEIHTGCRVTGCAVGPQIVLTTSGGEFATRRLIGCAGLYSDRLARLCEVDPGVSIVPFRGEYFELTPSATHLVRNLIYPVPDPKLPFLGVHLTRMIRGGIEAGPNAVLALKREGYGKGSFSLRDSAALAADGGFWRLSLKFWKTGLREQWRSWNKRVFLRDLQRLVPALTAADLVPGGAGVRAQAVGRDGRLLDDFHLVHGDRMIHVLNAPSPAATACLSIGATIAEQVEARFDWGAGRPLDPTFGAVGPTS